VEDPLPARRAAPERQLSRDEVEAVIGRAIELHVREAGMGDDALSESQLLRIGDELGLAPSSLRRALAEVDGGLAPSSDWLARHVGVPRAGTSRVLARPVRDVERELETYLLEVECMVVERRLHGKTVYAAASGLLAGAQRATRKLAGRHPLLGAERLELGVQEVDPGSCCVAVAIDLERTRRDHAVGGALGGVAGGGAAAAIAAVAVAPPLALVGLPVAAAVFLGTRSAYRGTVRDLVARLESVLDRVEHRELRRAPGRVRLLGL